MRNEFFPGNVNQKEADIEEVREAFELWRAARKKQGPFPPELWSSAVSLCKRYTKSEVCKALRLSYSDLNKQVNKRQSHENSHLPENAFFDLTQCIPMRSVSSEAECFLEIHESDGFSLKLHSRGELGLDIVSLCRIIKNVR